MFGREKSRMIEPDEALPGRDQPIAVQSPHEVLGNPIVPPFPDGYEQMLKIFWEGHDPTQGMRQGNDIGTQYRSAVYYTNDAQRRIVQGYIAQLTNAKTFREPIVTQVAPLKGFYEAEAYHQNYYNLHPNQPYIVINDKPKVEALRTQFAELWK